MCFTAVSAVYPLALDRRRRVVPGIDPHRRVCIDQNGYRLRRLIITDMLLNRSGNNQSVSTEGQDDRNKAPASGSILVVGGGISGLTTALEAAEVGYEVFLVEKNPYLGGRVAQLNQYFPKLCPPTCGLEINFRRIKDNPLIKVMTLAEVTKVTGTPGDYDVQIKINPRYVNENCTACGECAKVCQTEIDSAYDFGMKKNQRGLPAF